MALVSNAQTITAHCIPLSPVERLIIEVRNHFEQPGDEVVRANVARGGDGLGVALLQLCMSLLELHILLSQEVKMLLELGCLVYVCVYAREYA